MVVVIFQIVFHAEIYANDVFLFFKNYFSFGSMVVVTFQIVFYAEIYANDVFLFFKNYF